MIGGKGSGMRRDAGWSIVLAVAALLLAGAALRLRDVGGPWGYGIRDHEGVLFHRFARNAIATSDWTFWVAPSSMITRRPELAERYTNHPPLHYVLITTCVLLLGDHEWVVRLESCLFSILALLLVYAIARRELGVPAALLSAFCQALLPVAIYMATDVNFHTFNVATILLALWLYLRWLDDRSGARLLAFLSGVLVSVFTDWPSFFLVGCLPVHAMLTTPRGDRARKLVWLAPAVAIASLGGLLALAHAFPRYGDTYVSVDRYARQTLLHFGDMSVSEWIAGVWQWPEMFFGAPILVVAVIGTLLAAFKQRRFFWLLAMLWFVGVANVIVFPTHATYHYQWHTYIVPAVCLALGYLASELWQLLRRRSVVAASAVLALVLVAYARGAHVRLETLRGLDSNAAPSIVFARSLMRLAPVESLLLLPTNADAVVCFYSERNVMGGIRDLRAFAASARPAALLAKRMASAGVPVLYGIPSWLPDAVQGGGALRSLPLVAKDARFEIRDVSSILREAAADQRGTK
jgi:4-amino-4-deoxy-L-arabinose transferase-like glycosyltransferase